MKTIKKKSLITDAETKPLQKTAIVPLILQITATNGEKKKQKGKDTP